MLPESDSIPTIGVIAGGVAGLATAVNLLEGAKQAGVELRVTVFEKGAAAGGNLQTIRRDGWQVEWGPNGFLDNEPATLRLVDRLGLRASWSAATTPPGAASCWSMAASSRSPLRRWPFSAPGCCRSGAKLRIAGELLVPARKDLGRAAEIPAPTRRSPSSATAAWAAQFTETMLDPMVKGDLWRRCPSPQPGRGVSAHGRVGKGLRRAV